MPKETVYGEQRSFDPDDKSPQVPVAEVRWSKEAGYIQLVTKATDTHDGRFAGSLEETPETHFTDGFYVDLNRHSINQLIRNLRRARDQAFGKDE